MMRSYHPLARPWCWMAEMPRGVWDQYWHLGAQDRLVAVAVGEAASAVDKASSRSA